MTINVDFLVWTFGFLFTGLVMLAIIVWIQNKKINDLTESLLTLTNQVGSLAGALDNATDLLNGSTKKIDIFQKAVESIFAQEVVLTKGMNAVHEKVLTVLGEAAEIRVAGKHLDRLFEATEKKNDLLAEEIKAVAARVEVLEKPRQMTASPMKIMFSQDDRKKLLEVLTGVKEGTDAEKSVTKSVTKDEKCDTFENGKEGVEVVESGENGSDLSKNE